LPVSSNQTDAEKSKTDRQSDGTKFDQFPTQAECAPHRVLYTQ
jgi:hypothetical protein